MPLALPSPSSPVVRQLVVPPSVPLAGMDAHFHLDRLYIKMKQFHHRDVEASLWRKPKGMACQIIRAVPSYCFPEIWPSVEYLQYQLPESADRFSVGWHPTRVSDYFDARKGGKCHAEFYERVSLQRCIALGEVGVDYERERSPYGQGQQRELLRAMVQKAKALQKPLLLHIRDHNDGVSASEDCRKILIEAELPSAWPIYLHCYGYGWRELGRWFSRFTNVVVGLAPPILKKHECGLPPAPQGPGLAPVRPGNRWALLQDTGLHMLRRSRANFPGGAVPGQAQGASCGSNSAGCPAQLMSLIQLLLEGYCFPLAGCEAVLGLTKFGLEVDTFGFLFLQLSM